MNTYSIIVPSYNEEQLLPATLRALRQEMQRMGATGEVIVVDNNSTDRTAALAAESGARVVFEPVNQISRARNAGARAARGRYLIFVDADTLPSSGLLPQVVRNLEDGVRDHRRVPGAFVWRFPHSSDTDQPVTTAACTRSPIL